MKKATPVEPIQPGQFNLCKACQHWLPTDQFVVAYRNKTGYSTRCLPCIEVDRATSMFRCRMCQQTKVGTEFPKGSRGLSVLSTCNACLQESRTTSARKKAPRSRSRQAGAIHRLSAINEEENTAHCAGCKTRTAIVYDSQGRRYCGPSTVEAHDRWLLTIQPEQSQAVVYHRILAVNLTTMTGTCNRCGEETPIEWCRSGRKFKCIAPIDRAGNAKQSMRKLALQRKYGMTLADYDELLEYQGGVCAICKGNPSRADYAVFAIDHDHTDGRVRGLLCGKCNSGIGNLNDDPLLLQAAIDYLKEPTASAKGLERRAVMNERY